MYLNEFAKRTLLDRYMAPQDKTVEDIFIRSIRSYGSNEERKQRLEKYVLNNWYIPSTPVLTNAGTSRGNPIACFLNTVEDSRKGILGHYTETGWLASNGGGVGADWSNLRTIGSRTSKGSQSNGMLGFQSVVDRLVTAFAQGSTRRASYASFLNISHPEVLEFIDMRRPTGGDINRKNLNLHHGVLLTDQFMQAVLDAKSWDLIDPHTKEVKSTVQARQLWEHILETRSLTGEPYIIFQDTMNRNRPSILKDLNVDVTTSNLCTEITVATKLPNGESATGVCCLGALNLDKWDEYKDQIQEVVEDCLWHLWHVLDSFIKSDTEGAESAKRNAAYYRDVGLGTIGFHSLLQQKMIPFDSALAKSLNKRVYSTIHAAAHRANVELAHELGECQANLDAGNIFRCAFTHMLAIAPNASTSIFADASPGCEPWTANAFIRKTASGTYVEKNKYLQRELQALGMDTEDFWTDCIIHGGSIQHRTDLPQELRDVFKGAYELNQHWLVQHVADRQKYICQSQSLNLYFLPKTERKFVNSVHIKAWEKGVKSLYYMKTLTSHKATTGKAVAEIRQDTSEYECLGCAN